MQIEVTKIQEQFEADFKIWKRECETKMKLRETERENSIREQYRMERDRQIDAIVAKVDAESIKNQQDYDSKFGFVHFLLFLFLVFFLLNFLSFASFVCVCIYVCE